MDRKEALSKFKERMGGAKGPLKKILVLGILGAVGFFGVKILNSKDIHPIKWSVKTVKKAAYGVQAKVNELNNIEDANRRLKLENMNLRRWAETLKYSCSAMGSEKQTRKLSMRLNQETGERVGRTLASISYRPPTHLLPKEMYTLGVSYLKGQEDEKAAVILTFLTGLEEDQTFKTPSNYLMTGVAWYRLDHNRLANEYFDKVLEFKRDQDNARYLSHARLWKALTAQRARRGGQSQYWLRQLLDHHPRSEPASWVNPDDTEAGGDPREEALRRGLASEVIEVGGKAPKKAGAQGPGGVQAKSNFEDHGKGKAQPGEKVKTEKGKKEGHADHSKDHGGGAASSAGHDDHH